MSAVTAGGLAVDSGGTATLAVVSAEFKTTVAAGNHTIDYLSTPFNGTLLLGDNAAGVNSFAVSGGANSVLTIADQGQAYSCANAALTAAQTVSLTDSAIWQGVTKVWLDVSAGVKCLDKAANNAVGAGAPTSNPVTLTVPAGVFNGTSVNADALGLCVVVNGTSTLQTRTITGTSTIAGASGVTGFNSDVKSATLDTWNLNAYTAVIPWLVSGTGTVVPTYCTVNNGNTVPASAGITLTVLSTEGTVTGLTGLSLGAINAQTTELLTFGASGITNPAGTVLQSLSSMGNNVRYSALITVAAGAPGVSISCSQTDPVTGGKRAVPVLAGPGAVYFQ